jgi:hypothetical protein
MIGKIERIVVLPPERASEGEPFDQLLQGARVTFDTAHEPNGLRAEAVRIVKSGE